MSLVNSLFRLLIREIEQVLDQQGPHQLGHCVNGPTALFAPFVVLCTVLFYCTQLYHLVKLNQKVLRYLLAICS